MREFEILLSGEHFQRLIRKVEALAEMRGFEFYCYGLHGHFSGMGIRGEYLYVEEEERLLITVQEKPFLVPWSRIESELKKLFIIE